MNDFGGKTALRPSRREFLFGAGGLLLLGAAGCGGGADDGGGGGAGGEGGEGSETRAIEHRFGSTEIPGRPERVVTVGFTDVDPVLALGVKPVAVREWYGEKPFATWEWAQDELGDAEPEVLPANELNFERIAGLGPDLIVGVSSSMTEDEYRTLSEIAPTLPRSDEHVDFGVPWQEQTRVIGRALGREARAEELVTNLEGRFDRAREGHPEFEGASGVVVGLSTEGDAYTPSPYGPQDPRGRFLDSLGFEIPDEIVELTGESFFANLSRERLGLIDTDVLIWVPVLAESFAAVRNDPLYQQLDAPREGRDLFLGEALAGALAFGTVLSLPYLLDRLVPRISAAVDGDPGTNA